MKARDEKELVIYLESQDTKIEFPTYETPIHTTQIKRVQYILINATLFKIQYTFLKESK